MLKLTDTEIDDLEDQLKLQASYILNELSAGRKLARRLGQDVERISTPYLYMLINHYKEKE
jgi:hypothetical protein